MTDYYFEACANCRRTIKAVPRYPEKLEASDTWKVSHGICGPCAVRLYGKAMAATINAPETTAPAPPVPSGLP